MPPPNRPPPPRPGPPPGAKPMMGSHRAPAGAPPPLPPRPAGLMAVIGAGQIESIDDLGDAGGMNPIWLVTMRGGAVKLVVKLENDPNAVATGGTVNGGLFKAMSDVMGLVSPGTAMEVLGASEIQALNAYAARPISMMKAVKALSATRYLVKTKFDPTFMAGSKLDVNGAKGMSEAEKVKARTLFTLLRDNKPAWNSLGEIVIADYLIGNSDRISIDDDRVSAQNWGNVIFSVDGSKNITHALGLDAFDPYSWGKYLLDANVTEWVDMFGKYIKDKGRFPAIGQKFIAHTNTDRMQPLGLTNFGPTEGFYFSEGMVTGWTKQSQSIKAKIWGQRNVPPGLAARAKYLGWA